MALLLDLHYCKHPFFVSFISHHNYIAHRFYQLTSEKDRGAARLQEERERAERDQQAAVAEAVKGQATLRAEMAAMTQRMKVYTAPYVQYMRHCYVCFVFFRVLLFCCCVLFFGKLIASFLQFRLCVSVFVQWSHLLSKLYWCCIYRILYLLICMYIQQTISYSFLQTEELKRNALQDVELTKYREGLLTAHAMEIEKINDRHRNEMKKYHVSVYQNIFSPVRMCTYLCVSLVYFQSFTFCVYPCLLPTAGGIASSQSRQHFKAQAYSRAGELLVYG